MKKEFYSTFFLLVKISFFAVHKKIGERDMAMVVKEHPKMLKTFEVN
jgi:hypothetical protein